MVDPLAFIDLNRITVVTPPPLAALACRIMVTLTPTCVPIPATKNCHHGLPGGPAHPATAWASSTALGIGGC